MRRRDAFCAKPCGRRADHLATADKQHPTRHSAPAPLQAAFFPIPTLPLTSASYSPLLSSTRGGDLGGGGGTQAGPLQERRRRRRVAGFAPQSEAVLLMRHILNGKKEQTAASDQLVVMRRARVFPTFTRCACAFP